MASLSMFGGGFFFSPFTHTNLFQVTCICPGGGLNLYGPWVLGWTPTPRGRWCQINATLPPTTGRYCVQLGLGAPGAEVIWQPSALGGGGGSFGFPFVVDVALNEPVAMYTFPISLEAGLRLTVQASKDTPGASPFNIILSIWG